VLVDVTLYDGRSQLALWTGAFPAHIAGVLGLYRDISGRIATAIGAALSAQTRAPLAERDSVDPRAYDAALQGREHLERFTPADFDLALGYFERALAIDSTYAPAYVGVALAWGERGWYGLIPAADARPHFSRNLDKALALDPDLPSAHAALAAKLVWLDWDFEAGAAEYRRAIALDPNDAATHVFFGHVLAILGRTDEAVAQGRLAVTLDPLNSWVRRMDVALLLLVSRPEEALDVLRELKKDDPSAAIPEFRGALAAAGREEEALRALREEPGWGDDSEIVAALDRGWSIDGYAGANRALADVLMARSDTMFISAWWLAQIWSEAGETEKAVDWLERAVEQHDQGVPYMGVLAAFRHLRDNPRFRALARRAGVPLWKGVDQP
jgi:tetratricopeptide (TPR) repeat protein